MSIDAEAFSLLASVFMLRQRAETAVSLRQVSGFVFRLSIIPCLAYDNRLKAAWGPTTWPF